MLLKRRTPRIDEVPPEPRQGFEHLGQSQNRLKRRFDLVPGIYDEFALELVDLEQLLR